MAVPFYILHAGASLALSGTNLAILTVAFTLAGTVSNLIWGAIADRSGFRLVFLLAIALWITATLILLATSGILLTSFVFVGMGAAIQGFQHAAMNLTLEFGHRDDLPVRIAIANSTSEMAGALGPLLGGAIAAAHGYVALFSTSVAFLLAGGVMVAFYVPEPRHAAQSDG
jgi:MFS family permease